MYTVQPADEIIDGLSRSIHVVRARALDVTPN